MVFSLFNKKSDPRKGTGKAPDRAAATREPEKAASLKGVDPASRQGSAKSAPPRESVEAMKEAARRTAEKIDKIESEMIIAASPTANMPKALEPGSMPAGNVRPALASSMDAGGVASANMGNSLSRSTSIVLGDSAHANAIDVAGSQLPGILEEAAILYSNGQNEPARLTLETALQDPLPAGYGSLAWLMLFDFHQLNNDRMAFDSLAMDYAAQFEASPPTWKSDIVEQAQSAPSNSASFTAPAHVDEKIKSSLQTLIKAAGNQREVRIDFGAVRSIESAAATELVGFFRFFSASERPLTVLHAQKLHDLAHEKIEAGRRDEDESFWQLTMMCLRLLGQQQTFDDLSIDFCVTYEVSPPAWEPMPAWVRGDAESTLMPVGLAGADASSNAFTLKGELVGAITSERQTLKEFAQNRREVTIDCRKLRRLDFTAAGEVLNEVVNLRNANKGVLFAEPNYLVYTLMMVMGLHEVAEIRTRKA